MLFHHQYSLSFWHNFYPQSFNELHHIWRKVKSIFRRFCFHPHQVRDNLFWARTNCFKKRNILRNIRLNISRYILVLDWKTNKLHGKPIKVGSVLAFYFFRQHWVFDTLRIYVVWLSCLLYILLGGPGNVHYSGA